MSPFTACPLLPPHRGCSRRSLLGSRRPPARTICAGSGPASAGRRRRRRSDPGRDNDAGAEGRRAEDRTSVARCASVSVAEPHLAPPGPEAKPAGGRTGPDRPETPAGRTGPKKPETGSDPDLPRTDPDRPGLTPTGP